MRGKYPARPRLLARAHNSLEQMGLAHARWTAQPGDRRVPTSRPARALEPALSAPRARLATAATRSVFNRLRVGAGEIAFKHRAIGNPHAKGKLLHERRPQDDRAGASHARRVNRAM